MFNRVLWQHSARGLSSRAIGLIAIAGLALALLPLQGLALADTGAMGTTQGLVNQALHVLAAKQVPVQQRRQELRQIIEPRFDFTEMSRSALGYHWRSLTPAQRADFTALFKAFIEDAYLSKIQDYSGQQVNFIRQSSLGEGYMEVDTQIVSPGKAPIPVNYLLESHGDSWKIYDVTVDNISIIANYRNQFNRVMNERGFDTLMSDLRSKQQQLASALGQ